MKNRHNWVRSALRLLLATVLIAAVTGLRLHAQSDTASLRVGVYDASGAAVSGASVKTTNEATNVSASRTSASDGYATFDPIQRGTYDVEVGMRGFRTVKVTAVTLDVDDHRFVKVTMAVAPVTESVEVTAAPPALQTEQASLGEVVKGDVAVQLPLQARRY